jgi:hypothetical protein
LLNSYEKPKRAEPTITEQSAVQAPVAVKVGAY